MKGYYKCEGDVRGDCDHKHRTPSGARRCLEEDRKGCKTQGGYSDRKVVYHAATGEVADD